MTLPHDPEGTQPGRGCPLCGSVLDPNRGFTVDGNQYARCRGCDADIAIPLPVFADLKAFYRGGYYQTFGAAEGSPRRLAMSRLLLESIPCQPPSRLLDVGCGAGHLLAMARGAAGDVRGVDPSVEACDLARVHYGLQVTATGLEDAGLPDGTFDVATLINVLDQVPDPVALLAAVRRALTVKGLVVVRVPNGAFHRMAWEMIRHTPLPMMQRLRPLVILHPFSLNAWALHSLLANAGFEDVRIDNAPITWRDPFSPRGILTRMVHASLGAAARALAGAAAALTAGHILSAPSLLASVYEIVDLATE